MILSTLNGEAYRNKFSEKIKDAIKKIKNRWIDSHGKYVWSEEKDFCVFVRENGYMVILKDAYTKLSKTEYRQIPD